MEEEASLQVVEGEEAVHQEEMEEVEPRPVEEEEEVGPPEVEVGGRWPGCA